MLTQTSDAEHARFLLFDRVARFLRAASERQPLLLVLDDIHATDMATLMLLQFVARGLRGSRVLLLAAARDTSFATTPKPGRCSRRWRARPDTFRSRGFERDDLSEWISLAAPRLEADRVWAATEGNPLFVEELLAASKKRPDAAWTTSQMPLGIREAMRAHLSMVSERALALLEIASVLGREPGSCSLEIGGGLARARSARRRHSHRAFCATRERAGCVFRTFSCAMSSMRAFPTRSARRCISRRLARASIPPPLRTTRCSARAPKTLHATLELVQAAMREASGKLAHEDAARLGRRALETLEAYLAPADVCELLVAVGEALVLAGDLPGGQGAGERPRPRERARPPRASGACGAHPRCRDHLRRRRVGRRLAAQGARCAARRRLALRAQLMARLALALNNTPTAIEEQRRLVDVAVGMARRLGDEKVLFTALHNAAGSFPDELTRASALRSMPRPSISPSERDLGRIAPILTWHIVSWLELGEPEGALIAADRVERLLEPYTPAPLPLETCLWCARCWRRLPGVSPRPTDCRVSRSNLPPERDLRRADDARHLCVRNSVPPRRRWGARRAVPID